MSRKSTERYVQEAQEYICTVCDAQFFYLQPAKLACPKCGCDRPESLVVQPAVKDEEDED
ncbi:MAG: hypothetical protein C5B53_03565 [Candidatus Melainabacteria bacterium]|nr:MAG: hypothetical protein C5B53_03565 [Candidatus Melainabacteria bacterium]